MHKRSGLLMKLFIILSFMFVPIFIYSGQFDLNIIDTPKAYTSYKGDLKFDFFMYDNGGVLGSTTLAITDYIFLGVYFDAGQLIGSEEVKINQPGVLARFLISDGTGYIPPIAVGYSYFMKGDVSKVNDVIVNGIYIVSSQNYFLFGNEQNLSYGIRYPIIPLDYSHPENITLFVGTDISISPEFSIKGEIENIHLLKSRGAETFCNFSVDYNIGDLIALSLEFKYSTSINRVARLLRIGYATQF